ncbi:zinc ribbon domain-containing protein, partial [Actinosynnema sp. NPDC023658]|uniref:zinc ribbon domain-containing protein n=1 Tax=Actinosynnema sp. NPDC023658 TaxID=3155465 RepID=UPI0033D1E479
MTAVVRSCPQCGAPVQDGDDFCGNCGTYLGWSAEAARPEGAAGTVPAAGTGTPAETGPAAAGTAAQAGTAPTG